MPSTTCPPGRTGRPGSTAGCVAAPRPRRTPSGTGLHLGGAGAWLPAFPGALTGAAVGGRSVGRVGSAERRRAAARLGPRGPPGKGSFGMQTPSRPAPCIERAGSRHSSPELHTSRGRGAGASARGGGAWVRSPREPGPAPQVFECGWAARRAPDLHRLYGLCRSMHAWLRQDPRNVCVVHCAVSAGPSGRRRQGARTGGRARLATVLPGGRGARLLRTGAGAGTPGGSPEAQGPPWRLQPAAPGLRVPASCDLPSSSSVDAALSGPPGPPGKATARAAAASLVGTRGDTGAPTRHSSISWWES